MFETTSYIHTHCNTATNPCPISAFEVFVPNDLNVACRTTQRLLTTNDAPEFDELAVLLSGLSDARTIFADLGKGLAAIQAVVVRMQKAKDDVAVTIKKYEGATHPIRSMPDDIILHIFEWCTSWAVDDKSTLFSTYPAHGLSQVSRRWRALALASPRLWSIISISCDYSRFTTCKLENLSLLLRRSADCDLTVKISHSHEGPNVLIEECLRLLLPTAKRWRYLDLTLHYTFLVPFMGCTFDRLTEASFDLRHSLRPNSLELESMIWHTPNLTNLTLDGPGIGLSWDHIKTYSCNERGLKYLPMLTSVEHISFPLIQANPLRREIERLSSSGVYFPLTLPTLRAVTMEQRGSSSNLQELSDLLILPSSTTLLLSFGRNRSPFPTFHGSINRIQNLSIDTLLSYASPCDELISFLRECTSVVALYMCTRCARREVLKALRSSDMLPELTSLRIKARVMRVRPLTFVRLVETRSHPLYPQKAGKLTEVRIVESEPRPKGEWKTSARVTEDVLERWEAIRCNVNVLDVYENTF